ncbi:MAG: flavin reductase family protein [Rhodospirillales bacterium]|jgi:flavin reductase (DIM6/NTAB) family NADH-FMN oxidoreductase RutF
MIDARTFRDTLGRLPTGVCIITNCNDLGVLNGVTVGSFSSLSLDPPLVLWSLDKKANCHEAFREAKSFAVNVLSEDQSDLSNIFATKEERPWSELRHRPAPETGAPLFENCCAYIECQMETIHEGGDHDLFIGRVVRLHASPSGRPLIYFGGAYRRIDEERVG